MRLRLKQHLFDKVFQVSAQSLAKCGVYLLDTKGLFTKYKSKPEIENYRLLEFFDNLHRQLLIFDNN